MKFQDDISMPHTRTQTHTHTDKAKPMSPTFSKLGGGGIIKYCETVYERSGKICSGLKNILVKYLVN